MDQENQLKFDKLYKEHCMCLKLQGKAKATIEGYSRALRRFTEYLGKSPDQATKSDLRRFFHQLVKTHSWSTVKIDRVGLQFFYKHVLQKQWVWIDIVKPPQTKKIPNILTVNEVQLLLNSFTKLRYQAFFFVLYSMGLRISECLRLEVGDVLETKDSIHIRASKNNKDRIVPMPKGAHYALKRYWLAHRHPTLLFPAIKTAYGKTTVLDKHMDIAGAQGAISAAVRDCGFKKRITTHSLRHSYASHLLAQKVDIITVQKILGHESVKTTEGYLHLAKPAYTIGLDASNNILNGFDMKWVNNND
jgi:integrase/recombinase XerD